MRRTATTKVGDMNITQLFADLAVLGGIALFLLLALVPLWAREAL